MVAIGAPLMLHSPVGLVLLAQLVARASCPQPHKRSRVSQQATGRAHAIAHVPSVGPRGVWSGLVWVCLALLWVCLALLWSAYAGCPPAHHTKSLHDMGTSMDEGGGGVAWHWSQFATSRAQGESLNAWAQSPVGLVGTCQANHTPVHRLIFGLMTRMAADTHM